MIVTVQYMRAIAALMVVLQHISFKCEQYGIPALNFHVGYFGVDLFFIISGFIMCHTTYKRNIPPLSFIKNRVVRIFPLYWLLSSCALVIFIIKPEIVNSSGGKTGILSSFLLIPSGEKFLINNGWTLSYEILFYLIFSIFLAWKNDVRYLLVSVSIIFMIVIFTPLKNQNSYYYFLSNTLFIEFILGMISFYLFTKVKSVSYVLSLFLSLVAIYFIYIKNSQNIELNGLNRLIYAGLPMLAIFISLLSFERNIPEKLKKKLSLLGMVGDASYSIYLTHAFVLSPCAMIISRVINSTLIFVSILFLASIVFGVVCYKSIELRLISIAKNIYIK